MKILLTNDDGIHGAGLWSIANALKAHGHSVTITAPMYQQSGMAHALTVLREVEYKRLDNPDFEGWIFDGTPTDCVKIYLEALSTKKFDALISGINDGANLATDVLYSGTVGAAMEGFLHEISSVAVSLNIESLIPFEEAAKVTLDYIEKTMKENESKAFFHNINFPKTFKDGKPEFKFARLGHRDYINAFQQHTDEKGRTFYRVGGQVYDVDRSEGTDIFASEEGYVAITPLHVDLTDYKLLKNN